MLYSLSLTHTHTKQNNLKKSDPHLFFGELADLGANCSKRLNAEGVESSLVRQHVVHGLIFPKRLSKGGKKKYHCLS